MKLTTNSRYGLRGLVDLTANYDGQPVSLSAIAGRQGLSESYLEQVFSLLRKAGLINSIKGAQGGYIPAADAAQIKVSTILSILEGDLSIVDQTGVFMGEDPVKQCIKRYVWDEINSAMHQVFDSTSLKDLAEEYRRMRGNAR